MKRTSSNGQGFAAAEATLVIIILAIIGFIGWYAWHSKQGADKTSNTASQTTQTAQNGKSTQQTGYLTVKEWGVKMKQQQALGTASYTYVNTTADPDSIKLDSSLEAQIPQACGGVHNGGFSIVRTSQSGQDLNSPFIKQVGSYYYRFVYPQAGCDADTAGVLSQLNTGYNAMFDSLQAE